ACHCSVSTYLTPSMRRLLGSTSSFGMSMRAESGEPSSAFPSAFWKLSCPSRDRNQLIKIRAALGRGAWLTRVRIPCPALSRWKQFLRNPWKLPLKTFFQRLPKLCARGYGYNNFCLLLGRFNRGSPSCTPVKLWRLTECRTAKSDDNRQTKS